MQNNEIFTEKSKTMKVKINKKIIKKIKNNFEKKIKNNYKNNFEKTHHK